MQMPSCLLLSALLVVAVLGCGSLGAGVKVSRLPATEGLEPRPKGCDLEFLWKEPARAYDELGELNSLVTSPPPGGPLEVLRDPACELGAEAVIVKRDKSSKVADQAFVAGIAIRYREAAPAPAKPEAPTPGPQEPERSLPSEPIPGTVDL